MPSTGYAIASVAALAAIGAADRAEGYARLLLDDGSGNQTWVVYDDSTTSGDYQPDDTPATGYWLRIPRSTSVGDSLRTAADEAAARGAIGFSNAVLAAKVAIKTDTQVAASVSSGGSVAISGLSISHALQDASNSVILILSLGAVASSSGFAGVPSSITADGSPISVGDAAGNRARAGMSGFFPSATNYAAMPQTIIATSAPGNTTSISYGAQLANLSGSAQTLYLNRTEIDSNINSYFRTVATLLLLEVAA